MENHVVWNLSSADRAALFERFGLAKIASRVELRLAARGMVPALALEIVALRRKPSSVVVEIAVDFRVALAEGNRSAAGVLKFVREARVLEVAVRDAVAEIADAVLERVAFSHGRVAA